MKALTTLIGGPGAGRPIDAKMRKLFDGAPAGRVVFPEHNWDTGDIHTHLYQKGVFLETKYIGKIGDILWGDNEYG